MSVSADTAHAERQIESTTSPSDEEAWRAHPVASRVLRTTAVLLPVAVSAGVVISLDHWLPPPRSWEGFTAVAAVDVVAALCVALVVNRLAMRILPLATLLSLALVFPDRAPKRFSIALRANSTAKLRSRMAVSHDQNTDVATALKDLLITLAALGRHDRTTRGHCERVRAFVDLLAVEMDLPNADQDRLRWAALLHDIGKLRVPPPILRKPGKPTDKEWETLKRHPVDGAEIIRPLASWLGPWAVAVEQHHEQFDGYGYPMGLAGTDISLGGRILAVADAYEVMITSRPYKRPVRPEAARRELVRCAGQQFDPQIVRAFLGIAIGDLRKVMGLLGVLSEVPVLATVPRAEALIEIAGRHAIGVVGAAAGTGALIAAATLSPVHVPAASNPERAVAHSTAGSPTADKLSGAPTVSPVASSQSVTAMTTNDGSSVTVEPIHPTPDGLTSDTNGSSESNSGTGQAASGDVPAGTTASLHSEELSIGSVGIGTSVPANVDSTAKGVGSTAGSAAEGLATIAASTAENLESTTGSASEDVSSTTGPTPDGPFEAQVEHVLTVPGAVP